MAKLNKEQLKKLYDYGGTLSPKDWANMIDNMPENPIYNKKSLPIVKTTYEEVRELYNSGKMDPNVKYQFDYKYYDLFNNQRAYFQDLIIYLDGGTVKAEYTGVTMPNGEPITIDGVDVYDKSFTADFIFDSIMTSNNVPISEDIGTGEFYEEIRSKYVLDLTGNWGLGSSYSEQVAQLLKNNGIPHKVIIDDYNLYVEFYDVVVIYEQGSDDTLEYAFIYNNYILLPSDTSIFKIYTASTYTILAAIVNVQYDNGVFHKIFVDRYANSSENNHYKASISLLMDINFYNGNLDTTVEWSPELDYMNIYGISFTSIEYLLSEAYSYTDSELLIEINQRIYPIYRS